VKRTRSNSRKKGEPRVRITPKGRAMLANGAAEELAGILGAIIGRVAVIDRESRLCERTDLDAVWATLYTIKADAQNGLTELRRVMDESKRLRDAAEVCARRFPDTSYLFAAALKRERFPALKKLPAVKGGAS
jgi:hypothetical protein